MQPICPIIMPVSLQTRDSLTIETVANNTVNTKLAFHYLTQDICSLICARVAHHDHLLLLQILHHDLLPIHRLHHSLLVVVLLDLLPLGILLADGSHHSCIHHEMRLRHQHH